MSSNTTFFNTCSSKVINKAQQGDWNKIVSLYEPEIVSGEVFTLECDHGK